jgi:hypothetical protein
MEPALYEIAEESARWVACVAGGGVIHAEDGWNPEQC